MLVRELKVAVRSLWKAKTLSFTVIVTLALGIGVNLAIFSLVRAVLLKPLVNRNADRIVYIRQGAPGIGSENITFSVPEIQDLRTRVRSLADVAEFSVLSFTVVGLGEPRQVRGGVVTGNYFDVMGLQPVLGRMLNAADDGPAAAAVVVLTHQFWSNALRSDPNVIGTTIRLDTRSAQIVGVLEPSLPYPAATELIANLASSPHHIGATMASDRQHRMTEVFARMAPSATLAATRQELASAYRSIKSEYSEAYPPPAGFGVGMVMLREQLTSNARTVMIVLFAAALLIFVIACSNVANLVLARTVRRNSELAVRAAVGADSSALRMSLLAESLVLCGAGAGLGVVLASALVTILGQYGTRFSVRALDATVDVNLLVVGVLLALVAAVLLAYVPRLPAAEKPGGLSLASSNLRIAGGTRRQLNLFAVVQIGASFVLVTGAVMLLRTFLALQAAAPAFETSRVLVVDVPVTSFGHPPDQMRAFYRDLRERIRTLPGVEQVAVGSAAPWRDAGQLGGGNLAFEIEGGRRGDLNTAPRARSRSVSPGYFAALGVRQWVNARELRGVAREALALARALLDGNRERVAARAMAATDVIEAEAEVARRDEAVIVAGKNVANAEDQLRLMILNPRAPEYQTPLEPTDPVFDTVTATVNPVTRALVDRNDLKILRSAIETNSLNVRQLRNEALPDINLSAGFSARAVGGTESSRDAAIGTPVIGSLERGFGLALGDLGQLRYPGWSMQVSMAYPVGAVVAKAHAARAQVEQRQSELSLAALEQRVTIEIRTAQREVETNEKRLQSTATAVVLAERRLAAEEEKFLVGLSTSFFVFQAQRDLASARVARLGAVLDRRLSIADLEAVRTAPLTPLR